MEMGLHGDPVKIQYYSGKISWFGSQVPEGKKSFLH